MIDDDDDEQVSIYILSSNDDDDVDYHNDGNDIIDNINTNDRLID